jgi:hypothetical protein
MTIEVLPLPTAGRPAGFDPASVGRFSVAARVDRDRVAAGEAVTLTVTVNGYGNLRKLMPPKLPTLSGWKSYDPKVSVTVEPGDTIGGHKTIEYLLLPEKAGTTIIPSFELPYFDPQAKAYTVEKSVPLRIEVVGETGAGTPSLPSGQGGPAPAVAPGLENLLAPEIRPPRGRTTLRRDLGTTFYRSKVFAGVVVVPPLAFGMTVLIGRVRERLSRDSERGRRRKLRRLVRRRLGAAEAHMEAGRAGPFFMEIERVLRELLAAKLGEPVTGLPRDELRELLRARGFAPEGIIAELEECDHARFAPGGTTEAAMRTALERSGDIILQMEKAKPSNEVGS